MALMLLLACGQKPAPAQPSAVDRRIEAAERHERNRRYDLAEDEYRGAISEAGTPGERSKARRALASALLFWGKYAEGEVVLSELVRDSPRAVGAWHDLGMVRARLGKLEAAEKALRRAVALAPEDPRSRIALAALLVNGKRYREAQRQYRALLKLDIPPKIRKAVNRALALLSRQIDLDSGAAGR